jgi:glycosyltransferase involved in cell wall biosynthesis
LTALPDGAMVLLDALVAAAAPDAITPHRDRLSLAALVHMPFGDESAALRCTEGAMLDAMTAVVTTSSWTRQRLLDLYPSTAGRVHVAAPGVDEAPLSPGSEGGTELLCVAAVAPRKGHDLLIRAFATLADRSWNCLCIGSISRDPAFVEHVRELQLTFGLTGRVHLVGPRTGVDLDAAYAAADLLVLPSHGESYGLVVTEALARGIPVLATGANGLPEALGCAPDGSLPGILVPPGDSAALAGGLRSWLGEPDLRRRLRRSAHDRRATLDRWAKPSEIISRVLSEMTA